MEVVIVGDAAIGKTRWLDKLIENSRPEIYRSYQGKYTPTEDMIGSSFRYRGEYYRLGYSWGSIIMGDT